MCMCGVWTRKKSHHRQNAAQYLVGRRAHARLLNIHKAPLRKHAGGAKLAGRQLYGYSAYFFFILLFFLSRLR